MRVFFRRRLLFSSHRRKQLLSMQHIARERKTVAPLAWVSWVPGNPPILEQWVPEPINFEKKELEFTPFSTQNKQDIGVKTLK